ncbi:diguanylate cyclase domain-containing protein [Stutzerimonas kirkiae]|uniref:diguanylate cyclase domain-containing protein n=1 Tax=Stutzerimonas kirkiae TaxID=2211392 RepID=UPI0010385B26|nr:diguanylate cyclase [Stutzerimonas kirkiae]TBV05835.1 diguanylate cyclase response regulator [Stutzerimonas kirkiae]
MNHSLQRRSAEPAQNDTLPVVLIVDDQPINIAFTGSALEGICLPVGANDGEQALQLARQHQPDLILLDIRMRTMDGFETCRRLKSDPQTRSIPVIFLTALKDEENEEQGLRAGAIDYISKPFSTPLLRARVRNHLRLYRQQRQLERLAQLDGLTGIANRRTFDELLQSCWAQQAGKQPLALLMIDIDAFKRYNDSLGHQSGDDAIRRIARCIEASLQRHEDLVARYGGEEFACILPNTDLNGADHLARTIQNAVAALRIEHPDSPTSPFLTLSIGGAAVIPDPQESPRLLLRKADANLYQAKQSGRSRTVLG